MHSHISPVHQGQSTYYLSFSHDTCAEMIRYGQIKVRDVVIGDLNVNVTNFRSVTLAGMLLDTGYCEGTTYLFENHEYRNVIVTAKLEIFMQSSTATIHRDSNQLITSNNVACDYRSSSCISPDETHHFWTYTPPSQCEFNNYAILYQGLSSKVSDPNGFNPIIYFANTTENIQFGLIRKEPIALCGFEIFATEHAKFFIIENPDRNSFTKNRVKNVQDVLLTAYFNTKLVYLARHVQNQFASLYKDSVFHRCQISRQVILNSISHMDQHPDLFALAVMKSRGYFAIKSGEVAHIIQCRPALCRLRPTEGCYQELPVTCDDKNFFLKPNSHILLPLGIPRDCNYLLAPMYALNQTWFKVNPNASMAPSPVIIQPMEQLTWQFSEMTNFISSGIYSSQDLDDLNEHLMFPMKKSALLDSVARRLALKSHPAENGNFHGLLDQGAIESMATGCFNKLFSGFMKFGTFCAGIFGILLFFQVAKAGLDLLVHGYTLYTIYGWSFRLLGAFFSSITHLLIYRSQHQSSTITEQPLPTESSIPSIAISVPDRHHSLNRSLPAGRARGNRNVTQLESDLFSDSARTNNN